jgi:transposase-like protein
VAHKDKKKEAALADLISSGDSIREVAKRHSVSAQTLSRWADSTKITVKGLGVVVEETARQQSAYNAKKAKIGEKIMDLIEATLDASLAVAETLKDPNFIRDNPGGAGELLKILYARADLYVADAEATADQEETDR